MNNRIEINRYEYNVFEALKYIEENLLVETTAHSIRVVLINRGHTLYTHTKTIERILTTLIDLKVISKSRDKKIGINKKLFKYETLVEINELLITKVKRTKSASQNTQFEIGLPVWNETEK